MQFAQFRIVVGHVTKLEIQTDPGSLKGDIVYSVKTLLQTRNPSSQIISTFPSPHPVVYSGGWNTEYVLNSNGNPLFGFLMVFCLEQNGSHFVQNHWKY